MMKRTATYSTLLGLFLGLQTLSAQTNPPVDSTSNPNYAIEEPATTVPSEKVYEVFDIEKPPTYQGGEAEMYRFITKNITYPDSAKYYGVTGTVVATFVINTDGKISDVQIKRDIGRDCGKEVERILNLMPAWIPGEANGKPIRVRYTLPVRFKLGK